VPYQGRHPRRSTEIDRRLTGRGTNYKEYRSRRRVPGDAVTNVLSEGVTGGGVTITAVSLLRSGPARSHAALINRASTSPCERKPRFMGLQSGCPLLDVN
jgi:hypothetical protein